MTPTSDTIKKLKWFGIPRLIPYLRPYGKIVLWMVFFGLVGSAGDIIIPLFQQYALNEFVLSGALSGILWFVLAYVAVLIMQISANCVTFYLASRVEMHVGRDLKRLSFNHLQTLSFSYFNRNSVGYIHARVMSDTSRIGTLVSWHLMDGVWNLSYLIGSAAVMLVINAKLALCVLVLVPVAALLSAYFQKNVLLDGATGSNLQKMGMPRVVPRHPFAFYFVPKMRSPASPRPGTI